MASPQSFTGHTQASAGSLMILPIVPSLDDSHRRNSVGVATACPSTSASRMERSWKDLPELTAPVMMTNSDCVVSGDVVFTAAL